MSIWDRARTKAEELFGRAEQVYGESHGDAAATVAGEAHVMEAQAEQDEARDEAHGEARDEAHDEAHGGVGPETRHRPDDGLTGTR